MGRITPIRRNIGKNSVRFGKTEEIHLESDTKQSYCDSDKLWNCLNQIKVSYEILQQESVWVLSLKLETHVINHFLELRFNKGHDVFIVRQLLTLKNIFLSVIMVSQVEGFSWL